MEQCSSPLKRHRYWLLKEGTLRICEVRQVVGYDGRAVVATGDVGDF